MGLHAPTKICIIAVLAWCEEVFRKGASLAPAMCHPHVDNQASTTPTVYIPRQNTYGTYSSKRNERRRLKS